jgi:hypothetical protein
VQQAWQVLDEVSVSVGRILNYKKKTSKKSGTMGKWQTARKGKESGNEGKRKKIKELR